MARRRNARTPKIFDDLSTAARRELARLYEGRWKTPVSPQEPDPDRLRALAELRDAHIIKGGRVGGRPTLQEWAREEIAEGHLELERWQVGGRNVGLDRWASAYKRRNMRSKKRHNHSVGRSTGVVRPDRRRRTSNPAITDLHDVAWPLGLKLDAVEVIDKLNTKKVIYWRADGSGLLELEKALQQYGTRTDQYVVQGVMNDGRIMVDNQGGPGGGQLRWADEAYNLKKIKNRLMR